MLWLTPAGSPEPECQDRILRAGEAFPSATCSTRIGTNPSDRVLNCCFSANAEISSRRVSDMVVAPLWGSSGSDYEPPEHTFCAGCIRIVQLARAGYDSHRR